VAKQSTQFQCSNCHHVAVRWAGCCPSCSEWNSFIEMLAAPKILGSTKSGRVKEYSEDTLSLLQNITEIEHERMQTSVSEWDRVLGGGILPGSFIILTGDPGIGKSTLLLQIADSIAQAYNVIYFSSEESLQQVKNRAARLNITNNRMLFSDISCLEDIIGLAIQKKPHLLILDSIQNCYLSLDSTMFPGTIAQLREAGFRLMRLAKENNIAVLVTGHVTKDGVMAGPKVLEHMVDAVFYLQAEDRWQTRMLRSVKNRFGAINEVGFFSMSEDGMKEVANINALLLEESSSSVGGCLICEIEGSRPLLLELQALVVESKYGVPQRVISGIDHKRVVLIAAILEKYLGVRFSSQDIFFKVSGGFKVKESSSDLGIALALLSSFFQKPLPKKSVALAEISLTGTVKPINQIGMSVKEVEKFGLETIFIAHNQQVKSQARLISFRNVYELLKLFPEQGV